MKCTRTETDCFRRGPGGECLILTAAPEKQPCGFYKPSEWDCDTIYLKENFDGLWKRVQGFDGKYWVSSKGLVMSARNSILKVSYRKDRPYVKMENGPERHRVYLDTLVADAFLPEGEGEVIHKNGDFTDCRAENLERKQWL